MKPKTNTKDDSPTSVLASRRRRILAKLSIALCSVIVSLVAAEFAVRTFLPMHPEGWFVRNDHDDLYYRPAPNLRYTLGGHTYSHNSQGMRASRDYAPTTTRSRVAFVGDSVCYGSGVSDGATLVDVARRAQPVDCLNLGVPGYNVRQVRSVVRGAIEEFGASAVIYVFSENDLVVATFERASILCPYHLFAEYEKPGSTLRRLVKRSAFAHWLFVTIGRREKVAGPRRERSSTTHAAENYPPSIAAQRDLMIRGGRHRDQFARDLEAIRELCRAHGVPLLLIYVPSWSSLELDADRLYASTIRRITSSMGVEILDATDILRAYAGDVADLFFDLEHPNALGHERIGEAAAAWIERQIKPLSGRSDRK